VYKKQKRQNGHTDVCSLQLYWDGPIEHKAPHGGRMPNDTNMALCRMQSQHVLAG